MFNLIIFGLFPLPFYAYALILIVLTQLTIFSVTLYLHRSEAHRAIQFHPLISHFFRFWLWLTTGMITKEWAAIHRKHHARVETSEDPHSPQVKGLKKVFFEGAELYREEAKNQETISKFGYGTPDDWIERHLYSRHSALGIILMLIINFVLFGVAGIAIWAIQMAWIPLFAAGIINGIGHYVGYRNFECPDASRNIVPWGLFIGGEELHNNHHAHATSAKFSAKWWEIDIGWIVIRALQLFRLASPKRVLPKPFRMPTKTQIDLDTLKAVMTYRFHLMARYTQDVITPALREEKKRASNQGRLLLRRAKTALSRDVSMLKAQQTLLLRTIFTHFHSLRVVYQFRLSLQQIWSRSTVSQTELLEALQTWCKAAEATGIETLRIFALRLKTYIPQHYA